MASKSAHGEELNEDGSNYDKDAYEKPSVTVDVCVCCRDGQRFKVLLIKRKHPPFRDAWAIPGGFVDIEKGEALDDAAHRELAEETGLRGLEIRQLAAYGEPDRDPRMRVITICYYAILSEGQVGEVNPGDDAKEADWFYLDDLPELAFDHAKILTDLVLALG